MKKTMRKLAALLFAAVMLGSFTLTAFAAGDTSETAMTDITTIPDTGMTEETAENTSENTTDVNDESETNEETTAITASADTDSGNVDYPVIGEYEPKSSWAAAPNIEAEAAILIELNTGTVLYAKNEHEQLFPASITKIMTALLTIENCSMSDTVTYSYDAVFSIESGSNNIGLDTGEQLTVEESLYALLLMSANEVANGLAEKVGGSMSGFADLMNERAKELGCTGTNFTNAHGLHEENHYTTAYDMALISAAAVENATFRRLDAVRSYTLNPTANQKDTIYLNMQHKMLVENTDYTYSDALYGKTGYTDQAGNTLVTYAERDGMKLLCVVLKCYSTHYSDTTALFNYGFDNFNLYDLTAENTVYNFESAEFSGLFEKVSDTNSLSVEVDDEAALLLPNGITLDDLTTELDYDLSEVTVPNALARIIYSYNGDTMGEAVLKVNYIDENTFDFEQQTTEGVTEIETQPALVSTDRIVINIWYVIAGLAGTALVITAVLLIMRYKDNNRKHIRYAGHNRRRAWKASRRNRRRHRL